MTLYLVIPLPKTPYNYRMYVYGSGQPYVYAKVYVIMIRHLRWQSMLHNILMYIWARYVNNNRNWPGHLTCGMPDVPRCDVHIQEGLPWSCDPVWMVQTKALCFTPASHGISWACTPRRAPQSQVARAETTHCLLRIFCGARVASIVCCVSSVARELHLLLVAYLLWHESCIYC